MKPWTNRELKVLRQMATAGHSVDEAARALSRSRVAVRSRATHEGISFRHEINHSSARVSLPPAVALRLKMAARERGNISVHQLAREILSAVLLQQNRDAVVEVELQAGAAVAVEAATKTADNVVRFPAPAAPAPRPMFSGPLLYGRMG